MDKPSALLDLAAAVADRTSVDWPALEAEAVDPVSRAALKRLRLLDRIVRACAVIVPAAPAARDDAAEQAAPVTWGPLTIHERIGHGTFGDVYRAHDRRLDRIVALKLLKAGREADEASGAEVVREAQLLARVRHSNVVTVYGAERIDGRVGMWMEFVDGRTLEEELRATGPLPAARVIEVGLALCSALTAVHDAGLLHRDLKAQNVMRATDGRLLLTDFGAGRARADDEPRDDVRTELAGTPLYLAPEVLNGAPATVASELYSAGVLLYHVATGSFPARGRTLRELRDAHARGGRVGMHAYRGRVPKRLASVIDRATDRDPAGRFASLHELHLALLRCRGSARRVAAWAAVAVLGTVLTVAVPNLMWSMSPPLEVLSQSVVQLDRPLTRVDLVGTKNGLLYYSRDSSTFSVRPGQPGSEGIISNGTGRFDILDVNPVRDEYLAIREGMGREGELWVVSPRGENRRVANARCDTARWSPDGLQLLCLRENVLSISEPDGTNSRVVPTPARATILTPRWSPRGDALRFVVVLGRLGADCSLWEVRTDGTGLRPLLPGWSVPPAELFGEWTRDGRYFVFASMIDGRSDLWAIRERRGMLDWTTARPVRLTNGPISFGAAPIVSYDDRTMLAIGNEIKGALVRYDIQKRRFVPYANGLSATSVSFSPDAKSIAYITYPEKKLWRAAADGSAARQLVREPVNMDGASWSPDNKWIAFTAALEGRVLKIFLVPADGSAPPRAISPDDRTQGFPSWSPDGTQLCFGDMPESYGQPDGTEFLHIYDLASRTISDVPGSRGLWSCRWSPDNRYLAGVTISVRRDDDMQLNIYDRRERAWRPVPGALRVNTPNWSRDSAFIYYETEGGPITLRRVRVADGNVEDLITLTDDAFVSGWSGLAPDGSPLMLRDVGSTKLYALKLGQR